MQGVQIVSFTGTSIYIASNNGIKIVQAHCNGAPTCSFRWVTPDPKVEFPQIYFTESEPTLTLRGSAVSQGPDGVYMHLSEPRSHSKKFDHSRAVTINLSLPGYTSVFRPELPADKWKTIPELPSYEEYCTAQRAPRQLSGALSTFAGKLQKLACLLFLKGCAAQAHLVGSEPVRALSGNVKKPFLLFRNPAPAAQLREREALGKVGCDSTYDELKAFWKKLASQADIPVAEPRSYVGYNYPYRF